MDGGSERPKVSTWCGRNPGSTLHSLHQTADRQSRANQQHQRQRHLDNHEHVLRAMPDSARSPASLLEGFVQIRLGCFEGRCQTEKNSGEQREASRKEQHVGIKSDLFGARQSGWQDSECRACSPRGQKQTQPSAHQQRAKCSR